METLQKINLFIYYGLSLRYYIQLVSVDILLKIGVNGLQKFEKNILFFWDVHT